MRQELLNSVNVRVDQKNSVFTFLFGEKSRLLHLYNAVNGSNYTNPDELIVNTLENAVYLGRKNDTSFIIRNEMHLYEHQSTINPNMPLRDLFYVAHLFSGMTKDENIYGSRLIRLPEPHFIVFYNGEGEYPARKRLKLSDAFLRSVDNKEQKPQLELELLVININPGKNDELLALCEELNAYMMYIEKIRRFRKNGNSLVDAVNKAVEECINENILADFFRQNRAEVVSMSIFEYDQEKHLQMIAKENEAIGFLKAMVLLVNDGVITVAEAAKRSNMSEKEFLEETKEFLLVEK